MGSSTNTGSAYEQNKVLTEEQRLLLGRHGLIRRWAERHPLVISILLAILCLALNTPMAFKSVDTEKGWAATFLLLGNVIFAVLVIFRHRAPFAFLLLSIGAEVLQMILTGSYNYSFAGLAPLVFLYTIASDSGTSKTVIAYTAYSVCFTGPVIIGQLRKDPALQGHPSDFAVVAGFALGFVLLSQLVIVMMGRARRKSRFFDREVLKRFSQKQILAATEERARIAREMHDVVAHSLTVMIALSDSARIVGRKDPARAEEVLQELSSVGRTSLADMRRMLGVLRDPAGGSAPLTPAQGGSEDAEEHLAELVHSFASTGLPVTFEYEGQKIPSDHNLRLNIYRIVQESLTNALRYGQGVRRVQVLVRVENPDIWVTVANDGRLTVESPNRRLEDLGSGRGIAGMKERAALYGGTVEAGPNDVGGWTVRAHLRWDYDSSSR